MSEKEMRERVKQLREEAKTAGCIHRRDLIRQILRLEKELRTYSYYQREAAKATKNNEKRERVSA